MSLKFVKFILYRVYSYLYGLITMSFVFSEHDLIASAGAYNSASQTVGVQCNRGESVYVKTSQGGTMFNMYGWRTSTFTGYMMANGE